MAEALTIKWTAGDALRSAAVLESMTSLGAAADDPDEARTAWLARDAFRGLFELLARAERVRLLAEGGGGLQPQDIGNLIVESVGGASKSDLAALPEEVSVAYLATQRTVASAFYSARRITEASATIDVPQNVPAVVPGVLVVVAVVGVAAVAATAWFGAEAQEAKVEIEKHRISVLAQVDLYLKDLQARIAANAELPPPPGNMILAAQAQKHSGTGMLAAGLVLGGAAVAGAILGLRKHNTPTASNPTRRAAARSLGRRARTRAAPPPRSSASKVARTKKPARRKRNPLKRGYSRATVSRNISAQRRAGVPKPLAVAASLKQARAEWRRKNKRGALPRHLRKAPAKKARAAGKKAGVKTRVNARSAAPRGKPTAKRRALRVAPKRARKKNESKRSPTRAKNAKRRAASSKRSAPKRARRSVARRKNASRKPAAAKQRRATRTPGRQARRKRNAGNIATRRRSRTSSRKRTSRRA